MFELIGVPPQALLGQLLLGLINGAFYAVVTLTYGIGVALAAFAGVLAAPVYSVHPLMGANLIIVVFAVVVIGGMGSILGSVLTGFGCSAGASSANCWPGAAKGYDRRGSPATHLRH